MANFYVRSGGSNTAPYDTWAKAATTLAVALAAGAAGDDFWVSEDHSESTAGAVAIASPGTIGTPCRIICVNHLGSTPPVAADITTGAIVASTGANTITCSGYAYHYGIQFTAGNGASNASIAAGGGCESIFDHCKLQLGGTGSASVIQCGTTGAGAAASVELRNTTVKFAATSQSIKLAGGVLLIKDCPTFIDPAGSIPTSLFSDGSCRATLFLAEAADFSGAGSGKTICGAVGQPGGRRVFKDCKYNALATFIAAQTVPGIDVLNIHSDAAGTNYKIEKYSELGTMTTETTVVRTGGASDGGTPHSLKFVTTASCKALRPFVSPPLHIWLENLSSTTLTMYGINDGGAVAKNNEVWMEIEYQGDAASGQGSFVSTFPLTILTAGAANTSDSSTWGGSTNKFKLSKTFTPAQKGPATIRIYIGAASFTCYIDPKPEISGITVGKSFAISGGNYVNEVSGTIVRTGTRLIVG